MKISKNFRRDIEQQFRSIYGEFFSHSSLYFNLVNKVEDARDRLAAISQNDTQPFNDFIDAVKAYQQALASFNGYFSNLNSAMIFGRYDENKEIYETQSDPV